MISLTLSKDVAKDDNASVGTRASAGKDAASDKVDELKHKVSAVPPALLDVRVANPSKVVLNAPSYSTSRLWSYRYVNLTSIQARWRINGSCREGLYHYYGSILRTVVGLLSDSS